MLPIPERTGASAEAFGSQCFALNAVVVENVGPPNCWIDECCCEDGFISLVT